jgi:serine/threonine protein kinase
MATIVTVVRFACVTRYELLDRIGVGGMAEIFRGKAVAAGGFEKPVAIKRILPHLSQDQRFVELLIAEAKVLSLLKHRNIVQIFDVGLGDDGQYFLVMEYVDGKDIGAVQRALEHKRIRLPFDLCLHIGAEICEALEHAHNSRGPDGKPMSLVHRDVSPSNVLLSRAGEVKLTDFGIAKRAESEATQGGVVRGKFAYIAPEQARNEPLDPRSDVFSVGVLLWELICNRRLFSGLDDLAALRAVRDPVVKRPTEVDPRLPPEIDQIITMALAKDKTRRYAGCGQLGQKLRALRYSLDETVGDPATELAKIIDSTEEVERQSQQFVAQPSRRSGAFEVDGDQATVIRIQTADAFSAREDQSVVKARLVIDRFEEEETRQAQLTGDQMRMLREGGRARPRPAEDEETRAREPLDEATIAEGPSSDHAALDAATVAYQRSMDTPPQSDSTRVMSPRDRRTPAPLPGVRPMPRRAPTVPPPVPSTRDRGPTAPPPIAAQQAQIPRTLHGTPAPVPVQPMPMPPPQQHQPPQRAPTPYPPQQQQNPYYPPPPAGSYPGWGPPVASQHPQRDATPTAADMYERPVYPQHHLPPQVAGFERTERSGLQPWVLVVGAIIMAGLAFAITRAFIG